MKRAVLVVVLTPSDETYNLLQQPRLHPMGEKTVLAEATEKGRVTHVVCSEYADANLQVLAADNGLAIDDVVAQADIEMEKHIASHILVEATQLEVRRRVSRAEETGEAH